MGVWKPRVVCLVFFLCIGDCLSVFLVLFMCSRHVFLIVWGRDWCGGAG